MEIAWRIVVAQICELWLVCINEWLCQGNLGAGDELHWKMDVEEEGVKGTKFAGVVPGIKRVRKFEVIRTIATCFK